MNDGARSLGLAGERRAAWFYRLRGYRVVERNLHVGNAEVDLVVRRGRQIVFVEVKSRSEESAGAPWEAVDQAKRHRIILAADRYLNDERYARCQARFDVIAVVRLKSGALRLECFRDAFRAESDPRRPWLWR